MTASDDVNQASRLLISICFHWNKFRMCVRLSCDCRSHCASFQVEVNLTNSIKIYRRFIVRSKRSQLKSVRTEKEKKKHPLLEEMNMRKKRPQLVFLIFLLSQMKDHLILMLQYFFSPLSICRRRTRQWVNSIVALSSGNITECHNCHSICHALQIVITIGSIQFGQIGATHHFAKSQFHGAIAGAWAKFTRRWQIGTIAGRIGHQQFRFGNR